MAMRWTSVYWETKDGDFLELSDMTETHIRNCIAKIERSIKDGNPWRENALPYLKAELRDRERLTGDGLLVTEYDGHHDWDQE